MPVLHPEHPGPLGRGDALRPDHGGSAVTAFALPFLDFPLPFHCPSLTFHCPSLTFHCLFTAFP